LRQLAYKQIGFHVFLVCFSLVDPDSLENAKRLWVPELRWNCPNTPFLLVGTQVGMGDQRWTFLKWNKNVFKLIFQADLRTDKKTYERLEAEGKSPVSRWTGQRLTKQLKAVAYVECSATRGEGLKELFEEQTLRAGLRTWQKRGGADGRRTNGREESCSLQ
jgi:cell division control protein 42